MLKLKLHMLDLLKTATAVFYQLICRNASLQVLFCVCFKWGGFATVIRVLCERAPARIRWCDRVLPRSPQVVFVAEIGHGRKGPVSQQIRVPCYLNGHEGVLRGGMSCCRHPRAVPFAVCKYTFTANFIPLVGMRTLSLHVGRTLNVVFRVKPRIGCQS